MRIQGNPKTRSKLDVFSKMKEFNPPKKDAGRRMRHFDISNLIEIKDRSSEPLVFSFHLFDRNHEAFNLGGTCIEWYILLLDVLKELSEITWAEVKTQKKKIYDPHPHDWDKTNYKFQFDEETLKQYEGVQFSLRQGKGRVHGFLVGNRFYIYWLDPHHNMYDVDGYPGVQLYNAASNCVEFLNNRILELMMQIEDMTAKISELKHYIKGLEDEKVELLTLLEQNGIEGLNKYM